MLASDRKPVESFNTLIGINNNRVESYSYVLNHNRSAVLNALFTGLVDTSLFCNRELIREVYKLGGKPREGTVATQPVLDSWLAVQDAADRSDNRKLVNAVLAAECFAASFYSSVVLRYSQHYNSQQSSMLRAHVSLMREIISKVDNLCGVFERCTRSDRPEGAIAGNRIGTTISLIEPLKTAGRRILTTIGIAGSNFGPSIR